ncbi:MAG: TonB-dependent receptor [Flavobacterium sp.]|nr:TonB-dependent receptor [Flavobacterium sp.]
MNTFLQFTILLFSVFSFSQNIISGKIIDQKKQPIPTANIFLEGTYDGTSSDEKGNFSFTTTESGNQTIVISFLSFETTKQIINVTNSKNITIVLRESVNSLDAVIISAGTLESGDKARVSVLKPLDIVTTAGSNANIVSALQTLPGTQNVGESGRLFVRGGESDETQTYVDGLRVAQPYGSSANNTPARGRFSPFLFSGVSFSTGGYSAEYGDALSSVLLLNTKEEADADKTEMSFMTVGLGLGRTKKWNKSSLSFNTSCINLKPYQLVVPQRLDFNKPFQSASGESVFRYQFANGLLKVYAAFDAQSLDLNQEDINQIPKVRFSLNNNNLYLNSSYKGNFGEKWQITTGLSYGYSENKFGIDATKINNYENTSHLKLKLRKSFSDRFKLSFGGDYFHTKFNEDLNVVFRDGYNENILASFAEADIFLSKKLAFKAGIRASNNNYINQFAVTPRFSLGYKFAKNSQFSLAYGEFTQAPKQEYLKFSNQFINEKTSHYILNYQYNKDGQTLRLEAYYKDYRDLVKFNTSTSQFNSIFNNQGNGYAKGLELFWRDNKNIKNLEYWLSYSYIDTERDYRNFPTQVTPNFVAKHNMSLVTKYWISDWNSQVGFTASFASGRPYNNPNEAKFMNSKTIIYQDLSFNWAYLLTTQKILYFSMTNVLGANQVFGYDYAKNPNSIGIYERKEINPIASRFFFLGFFWTISKDKKDNQLKNL